MDEPACASTAALPKRCRSIGLAAANLAGAGQLNSIIRVSLNDEQLGRVRRNYSLTPKLWPLQPKIFTSAVMLLGNFNTSLLEQDANFST